MSDLASALRAGRPVTGTWLSLPSPGVAETVAGQDTDFVVVDTEHASASLETVENVLRAVEAAPGDTEAIARVPWNDPVRIKRLLDAVPAGLVVPMVETTAEARDAVSAMRFPPPPDGERGIAASRASDYTEGFEEYVGAANEDLLTVLQVESATGVENAEAIAEVDGVDALFVGPADLSASIGTFPDTDDERVVDAVESVVAAGAAADVPVGTLAVDPAEVDRWVDRGMDFLVVGVDFALLADGTRAALSAAAEALED